MGRISRENLDNLKVFISSLPDDVKGKCTLCNETLTHIVKSAEAETGAGTATVTRIIAEHINDGAAPGDEVKGHALNERVRQKEGLNDRKIRNPENNHEVPNTPTSPNRSISSFQIVDNITNSRKCLVSNLHQLKRMSNSGALKDDRTHKRIEDELSLIVTEAKVAGVQVRGLQ